MLDDVARELDAGRVDIYACVALRATKQGRKKNTALPPVALHADLDEAPTGEAAELLRTLDPIRVGSGSVGHEHAHVVLDRPISIAEFNQLEPALRDRLGADDKISDADMLRLPGTWNFKTSPPRPVCLIEPAARVWAVDDLARLLGVDLATTSTSSSTSSSTSTSATITAEPVPDLLPHVVREALDGAASTPDRSRAISKIVFACVRAGLTEGQTLSVVARSAPAARYKNEQHMADDVARMFGKSSDKHADWLVERAAEHAPAPTERPRLHNATAAGADEQDEAHTAEQPAGLSRFLLPDEVWKYSPVFEHVCRAAFARLTSPDAVLHGVFAIMSSLLHHETRVETGKGASPLSYFYSPVGESGAGKTEALKTARELLAKWSGDRFAITAADGYVDAPLGSGEGLIEAFMGRRQARHDQPRHWRADPE